MESLMPAIYPIIKDKYALVFVQMGIIRLTFQIAGSLLQPLVGHYTDQHPMPYSTAGGIIFTLLGLNFGMGGIAAAILGGIADRIGIERVYQLCSFLPLVGLLTLFLPRITDHRTTPPAK